jgi:hypothetical protein
MSSNEIKPINTNKDRRYLDQDYIKRQVSIIKNASENAKLRQDYYSAHDENVLYSIEIIEKFLRKTHRLCYGGQAINAHLPAKYKFYNPDYSIPDYDFFTPSQIPDIRLIIKELREAGFEEISVREGMHEGTLKVYVNYIPVADITEMDPAMYKVLSDRDFVSDGISYMDASTLRMLMYLELSRPHGEVSRWQKVFERLLLFNEFVPQRPCHVKNPFRFLKHKSNGLTEPQINYTIQYLVENKLIFAGADLINVFDNALKTHNANIDWIVSSKKPIIFYSSQPQKDAKRLIDEFKRLDSKSPAFKIKLDDSGDVDLVPTITTIIKGKTPLIFIINQTACHSYFNVPIRITDHQQKVLKIASIDTLITLFFSLGLMQPKYFSIGSMECLANKLVDLSTKTRDKSNEFIFPFISIKCMGHQTSLPSLIRQKVTRITSKKDIVKKILEEAKLIKKRRSVRHKKAHKSRFYQYPS